MEFMTRGSRSNSCINLSEVLSYTVLQTYQSTRNVVLIVGLIKKDILSIVPLLRKKNTISRNTVLRAQLLT